MTSPRRIAHLGLGAFFRAHQAWYTEVANRTTQERWEIIAFTGRSPAAATRLARRDFDYGLAIIGDAGTTIEHITAISSAWDGADANEWRHAMKSASLVTLTITEAGYSLSSDALREESTRLRDRQQAITGPGRLVDGLRARRDADGGPVALVSCDNLRDNGGVLRRVVLGLADDVDAEVAAWIRENVSFVSTVVDRITPSPTTELIPEELHDDPSAVVTERHTSWILSGRFPAGRPQWELAGAIFVDDIEPYEQRKLWLLNAGHSLLAALGPLRGHESVDAAVTDELCRSALDLLWDDASEVLPFEAADLESTRAELIERFSDTRIRHELRQIAKDAELKLRERVAPVVRRRLDAGLTPGDGELTAIAAWMLSTDGPSDELAPESAAIDILERLSLPTSLTAELLQAHRALSALIRKASAA